MKGSGYLQVADIQIPMTNCCSGEELLSPLQTFLTGRFFIFSLDFEEDRTIVALSFQFCPIPVHHE
jgi:hypothetical protein